MMCDMKRFSLFLILAAGAIRCSGSVTPADSLLLVGDSLMATHDVYHALCVYQEAFGSRDDAAVRMRLAKCHYLRASYRQCTSLLEPLPSDSLSHDAMRQMFYSYKTMKDTPMQMHWGRELLKRWQTDAEVVADLALAYNLNDDPERALAVTGAYEAMDSTNILVKRQTADAQFFMKEYPLATRTYERLLALGDSTFSVHYSLGMCYEQLERMEESCAHYGVAVQLTDSAKAWPLFHLGAALVKAHRAGEGIPVLLKALMLLQPEDGVMYTLYNTLAEGYYAEEQWMSAVYDWQNALKYNPQSLTCQYNIAQTYEYLQNAAKAEDAYREFLRLAYNKKSPNKELQDMITHAENYANLKEKMAEERRRIDELTRKVGQKADSLKIYKEVVDAKNH